MQQSDCQQAAATVHVCPRQDNTQRDQDDHWWDGSRANRHHAGQNDNEMNETPREPQQKGRFDRGTGIKQTVQRETPPAKFYKPRQRNRGKDDKFVPGAPKSA
jgi:hypothetical protein